MPGNNKHNRIIDDNYVGGVYVPLLAILTIIALATSLQSFFFMFSGPHNIFNMLRFVMSKLVFAWYYLLLAFVLQKLSRLVFSAETIKIRWYLIHIPGIAASLILHQLLIREVDALVFRGTHYSSFYQILFQNTLIWFDLSAYVFLLLIFQWMEYRKKILKNDIRYADLEMKLMNSKIRELRTKLHPGFLFKTFSTISEMLHLGRNSDANMILSLLSDFLRTTVYESDQEYIILQDELRFLNQYLAIEKIRLKGRLSISQEIEPNTLLVKVPIFFLQPIAEDLISESPGSHNCNYQLSILTSVKNEYLEIAIGNKITDLLSDYAPQNLENVKITKERMLRLYNNESFFSFDVTAGTGTEIIIKLPLNYKFQNESINFIEELAL
jgi:sensor histidine kinase YesM